MIRGMYTAASGMITDQRRLDVIANNLANASTAGYKRDTAVVQAFERFLVVRKNDNAPGTSGDPAVGYLSFGTLLPHTSARLTTGSLRVTGNDLDVAIEGDGFFTVATPRGTRYTRNGSFRQDAGGFLVTQEGHQLLVGGRPVRAAAGGFSIRPTGEVMADGRAVGNLDIVTSQELGTIRKEGDGFWTLALEGEPSALVIPDESSGNFKLKVGYLESSNVEPVLEMVEMMTIIRNYEANQRLIHAQDDALNKSVNEVGRI